LRLAMTPFLSHFRAIWGVYQTGAGSVAGAVPAPGTLLLFGAGLLGLVGNVWRRERLGCDSSAHSS
jgi:PEP-CTERM motif-containing protein